MLSKNHRELCNLDALARMFIGSDGKKICVTMIHDSRTQPFDSYETDDRAIIAMEIVAEKIRTAASQTTLIYMPTEEECKLKVSLAQQDKTSVHHYRNGQKTKDHGAS